MIGRVLLLAGTREARELAGSLAEDGNWHVTASLAGVTDAPAPLPVETRTGGFGGADGLAGYLQRYGVDAVIDATHPFAINMTGNAVEACRTLQMPLLRVERPPWVAPRGAHWVCVATLQDAAAALPAGARAFLTVGANGLAPFAARDDVWFLVRTLNAQCEVPLARYELVAAVPPNDSGEEVRLMRNHRITHLVTKNAGGTAHAKLQAAADLSLPTIMVERPAAPDAETVTDTAAAIDWLYRIAGPA